MSASAQSTVDAQSIRSGRNISLKIYFPYDDSYVDSTYMYNRVNLHLADSLLRDTSFMHTIETIEVTAQSSPEGSVAYNTSLSERRRLSLEEYFTTNYPHIDSAVWSFDAVAENWVLFHQHLLEDPELPLRDEVIAISSGEREADDKEWLLKTLDGGSAWRYIKDRILPSQRFGASMLFIPHLPFAPSVAIDGELPIPTVHLPAPAVTPEPKLLVALRSNLLLDVVSVINIGVEIPIGTRWSVVGEVVYPWWRSWGSNLTVQIESYHAELKYWLGERATKERLQGWSVGLYGGWGLYDLQPFSENGVQGDFFDVGAQVAFSHPLAKNLYMEYAVGLGYISTNYNNYKMAYDTAEFDDIKVIPYPWMNNKLRSVLPTRLGVSLVWHINAKRRSNTASDADYNYYGENYNTKGALR